MKKTLLSLGALALALSGFSQLNAAGNGLTMDFTNASSFCFINAGLPGNGGVMSHGGNFVQGPTYLTTDGLILESLGTLTDGVTAAWFAIPYNDTENDACPAFYSAGKSVNLTSAYGKLEVTASSCVAGATLELFIGGGGQWSPAASTYNIGDGSGRSIIVSHTFTTTGEETFVLNIQATDREVWDAFEQKEEIDAYGFRTQTADAVFTIKSLKIGADAAVGLFTPAAEASFEVFPNPASSDVVNFSKTLNNVVVMNALGSVVFESASAKELNVASFDNGMYIIKSDEGSTKLIVE